VTITTNKQPQEILSLDYFRYDFLVLWKYQNNLYLRF